MLIKFIRKCINKTFLHLRTASEAEAHASECQLLGEQLNVEKLCMFMF